MTQPTAPGRIVLQTGAIWESKYGRPDVEIIDLDINTGNFRTCPVGKPERAVSTSLDGLLRGFQLKEANTVLPVTV